VLTAENREPVHADHIIDRFARLIAAAGVPTIQCHDLVTPTQRCCSRQASPQTSSLSGLAIPRRRSVWSIYSHVLTRQQAEAAARLSPTSWTSGRESGEG
jgi:hypothetical protein